MSRAGLFRPRRILASILLFLVLASTGFAAVAFGEGDEGGTPTQFQIAAPSAGDKWGYDWDVEFEFGPESETDRFGQRMSWLDAQLYTAPDGVSHATRPLFVEEDGFWRDASLIGMETGELLAKTVSASANATTVRQALFLDRIPTTQTTHTSEFQAATTWFSPAAPAFCGYRSDLQGQLVSLDDTVTVHGLCDLTLAGVMDESTIPDHGEYRIVGQTTWGSAPAIVLERQTDLGTTRLHFVEHIPYPVRFAMEFTFSIAALYAAEGGNPQELQELGLPDTVSLFAEADLDGFEAGTTAWYEPMAVPAPRQVPTVQLAPRAVWGPQDNGANHVWPLSQAWRDALTEPSFPDLANFMRQHPDAYVRVAEGAQTLDASGVTHSWAFEVFDDGAALHVTAARRERPPEEIESLLEPVEYSYQGQSGQVEASWSMDRPPAQLPHVLGAMAARDALYPDAEPANVWGFDLRCEPCGYETWVGHRVQTDAEQGDAVNGYQFQSTFVEHRLSTDATGALVAVHESVERDHVYQTGLSPLAPGSDEEARSPDNPKPIPVTQATTWGAPTAPAAAGVTLGALLISVVYWGWPILKTLPAAGLFSRIERDSLLDNPVRASLWDAIQASPGIHFHELGRQVGAAHGAMHHHVRKLVGAGLVSEVPGKGYTCYFAKGAVDHRLMAAAPLLKADAARRILEAALASPGIAAGKAAALADVSPSTLTYHAKRLESAGLLELVREGRTNSLMPTPLASQASQLT